MDCDELVRDTVEQVRVRYDDYVDYQKSEGLDVEPFDAVAEQLLEDEVTNSIVYYNQMWTIIERTCDDVNELFDTGFATFDGTSPYSAFLNDCANTLYL